MDPLQPLLEADLPGYPLPETLARLHGGAFGLSRPDALYSNFVATMDGVVALGDGRNAGSVISGKNEADRFLMALLRACADVVLVGAGTLRATPGHRWTAEHLLPDLAGELAELRRNLGLEPEPRLALLTAGGMVDPGHPGLAGSATVLTTARGAERLRREMGASTLELIEAGDGDRVDISLALAALRRSQSERRATAGTGGAAHTAILTEGGPQVMGELAGAGLLDEVFLTISPVLGGRDRDEERPGFVQGLRLMPERARPWRLLSVHRHGDHLFVRWQA